MSDIRRVIVIVADGCGIGEAPDAASFGDVGADTLGNCAKAVGGIALPTLERWGIGTLKDLDDIEYPPGEGVIARLVEKSAAKDTPVGHFELMGVVSDVAAPVYPDGFPGELVAEIEMICGKPVLANCAISGTTVIEQYGEEHTRTGGPIVYTSGDSVLQVATHEDVVSVSELHVWCEKIRNILDDRWPIQRVIARPFAGVPGAYVRTAGRHDWTLPPPARTALDVLSGAGVDVVGIGKIDDIFSGHGIDDSYHDIDNPSSLARVDELFDELYGPSFVFCNLVEFDSSWGHRRDVQGFAQGLKDLDTWLGKFSERLDENDVIIITADHGNDPTWVQTTDHTRERVPFIAWRPGGRGRDVGVAPMTSLAATICDLFNVNHSFAGPSFAVAITGRHT